MQRLTDDWFDLLAYCETGQVDRKEFKTRHNAWAGRWVKLNYEEQGWITEQIAQRLKEPL